MIPDEPKIQSERMPGRQSFYLRMGPAGENFGWQDVARAHRPSETSVLTDPQAKLSHEDGKEYSAPHKLISQATSEAAKWKGTQP